MAGLNELLARWLQRRLRPGGRAAGTAEERALLALLEEEQALVRRLKAAEDERGQRHARLKERHDGLKREFKVMKEQLRLLEHECRDLRTELAVVAQRHEALMSEAERQSVRPGLPPLVSAAEDAEWRRFYALRRKVWKYPMRLGVLRQHEARPPDVEKFPRYDPPGVAAAWPTVSIVTPSYQQAVYLERTMASVLGQDYPHLEYRVMDGGSTDGSVEILRRYGSRLAGWHSAADNGPASAINRGLAESKGEIMAWLNSDDLLMPGAVRFVAAYFARHPEVDAVYGNRLMLDERDQQVGRWVLPAHDGAMLRWMDYIPQETLFWRRSLWEKTGGALDESFGFAFDWDLLLRFEKAGARLVRLPWFLGCFRVHDAQKSTAEIGTTGRAEMARLRQRELGAQFTEERLERRVVLFQQKALWHDKLLRWGVRWPLTWGRRVAPARAPLVVGSPPAGGGPAIRAFCTYFDLLYAAQGLAMIESLLRHCPAARVTVLCLDDALEEVLARAFDSRVETMRLPVLVARQPALGALLPERDLWERYALIKPFLIDTLMDRLPPGGMLAFVDADTYFFADPAPLFAEAEAGSVAISPHRLNAETESLRQYGRFNAGFSLWRHDAAARACVRDWLAQCSGWCHCRAETDGRFMDQGYLNDWPTRHRGVVVLSHPGENVAPWNVGSHRLALTEAGVKVDGRPLLFFHFSGLRRGENGRWTTFYNFAAMRQSVVLNGIYRPYLEVLETVSARLVQRHGRTGLGTVRDLDPAMPVLEVSPPAADCAPMMIWLPSFPRSGNKLARLILASLFDARTFTVYSQLGEPDQNPVTPEWSGPFPDLLPAPAAFSDCLFIKTHELPATPHPAIYIVRDGRDAYVSYAHFVRQHFPDTVRDMSYEDVLKTLIRSTDHFGGWSAHVRAWTSRPSPTAVIRFEDMITEPAQALAAACAQLGVTAPAPQGRLPGFDELKAAEPKQFRKGKAGGWREEMPPKVEELFWSLHGETMTALGYTR